MKASALFGAGWEDESVEVLWKDRERIFCRLWHDGADAGKHAFITFPVGTEQPTSESITRLRHEYQGVHGRDVRRKTVRLGGVTGQLSTI
jgi:hypothetical protein